MAQIKITLNGEENFIKEDMTISNLIENLELDLKKIAIERNLEIVNSQDFAITKLKENDVIEIVHFIGGG